MPIARKGEVILILAAFLIPLIPKPTLAGNKTSKIGKLHYKSSHHKYKSSRHRGDRTGKLDCGSGKIAKFDGLKWICAPDNNKDTLGELNCAPGKIAKFDGSEWICASDDNTDMLGELNCVFDEIAKFDGSEWICASDDISDTLGQLSCSDGQIAKYDETSEEWACADVGDGSQPCPEGFVVLNDKVCIELEDEGVEFSWFDANRTCIINNARLCTVGEWVAACQENIIDSTELTELEWTDDLAIFVGTRPFMTTTTFGDCTVLGAVSTTNEAAITFRCCQDR
jgi:hypothetical protein